MMYAVDSLNEDLTNFQASVMKKAPGISPEAYRRNTGVPPICRATRPGGMFPDHSEGLPLIPVHCDGT